MSQRYQVRQCRSLEDANFQHLMMEGMLFGEHGLNWKAKPDFREHHTYLAFDEHGKAVGFSTILRQERSQPYSIHFGFDSGGHRKPKLVKKLAKSAIFDAREAGVKEIFAVVNKEQLHIRNGLERLGFKVHQTFDKTVHYKLTVK